MCVFVCVCVVAFMRVILCVCLNVCLCVFELVCVRLSILLYIFILFRFGEVVMWMMMTMIMSKSLAGGQSYLANAL